MPEDSLSRSPTAAEIMQSMRANENLTRTLMEVLRSFERIANALEKIADVQQDALDRRYR